MAIVERAFNLNSNLHGWRSRKPTNQLASVRVAFVLLERSCASLLRFHVHPASSCSFLCSLSFVRVLLSLLPSPETVISERPRLSSERPLSICEGRPCMLLQRSPGPATCICRSACTFESAPAMEVRRSTWSGNEPRSSRNESDATVRTVVPGSLFVGSALFVQSPQKAAPPTSLDAPVRRGL